MPATEPLTPATIDRLNRRMMFLHATCTAEDANMMRAILDTDDLDAAASFGMTPFSFGKLTGKGAALFNNASLPLGFSRDTFCYNRRVCLETAPRRFMDEYRLLTSSLFGLPRIAHFNMDTRHAPPGQSQRNTPFWHWDRLPGKMEAPLPLKRLVRTLINDGNAELATWAVMDSPESHKALLEARTRYGDPDLTHQRVDYEHAAHLNRMFESQIKGIATPFQLEPNSLTLMIRGLSIHRSAMNLVDKNVPRALARIGHGEA